MGSRLAQDQKGGATLAVKRMFLPSIVALALGLVFAALWAANRLPGTALAATGWLLYAPYEYLMYVRVLCSGECNIRVDLLLLWPLLLCVSLAVPVRYLVRQFKASGRRNDASRALLRQAVAADIPAIWKVRYSVTENTLAPGVLTDEDCRREIEDTGRGWVVEEHGEIEAFAIGNAQTGNVWAMFVRPQAQGKGFGSRLHETMLAWFRTQPVRRLWLTTGTTTRARAFYERRGWVYVGPSGADEVRYERDNAA